MKFARLLFLMFGFYAAAAPVRADIDFTLCTKQEGEGAPDPENRYIKDGDSHIYLRIPRGWLATGGERLVLQPEQSSSGVYINQLKGVQALPLDPGGLAVLRKAAQATLPSGAKEIKPAGEVSDLLPVFGWKSFEATFDYEFYGQRMRSSVLYINMIPGRVVQASVTALVPHFEQVHEKMRKLMFGWFEPKRDLSPNDAKEYEEGGFKGG